MTFWRKNGMLVGIYDDDNHPMAGSTGIPIRCDVCPCVGGRFCKAKIRARKRKLLASGDYELIAEYADNFNCAEFEYDDEHSQWVCTRHSEGTLVQALRRSASGVMPSSYNFDVLNHNPGNNTYSNYASVYLISGVTLRNVNSGQYVTIGCACNYDTNSHACTHRYALLDGYCISGEVNVYDDETTYSEYHVCDIDRCDAVDTALNALQSWYGGTIVTDGFVVDKTSMNSSSSGIPTFTTFHKLYIFQNETDLASSSSSSGEQQSSSGIGFDGHYILISCDCYNVMVGPYGYEQVWDDSSMLAIERNGICSSSCRNLEYLQGWADEEGWTLHGEGFLTHIVISSYQNDNSEIEYMIGDWYDFNGRKCMECAESSDSFYYIWCNGCDNQNLNISKILKDDLGSILAIADAPSAIDLSGTPQLWTYLPFKDACTCTDEREILLTYPDEFGVVDISFGSNTKYHLRDIHQDNSQGEGGTVWDDSRYDTCFSRGSGDSFLDYRTMCVINKALGKNGIDGGNVKYTVRWLSPEGSLVGNGPNYIYSHDLIEFAGHAVPFSHDDDLNWDWTGTIIQWVGSCGSYGIGQIEEGCFDTAEKASNACSNHWLEGDDVCSAYGSYNNGVVSFIPRVSPPDKTHEHHPCEFFTCDDPNGYGYTHGVRYAYDTLGQKFTIDNEGYSYNLYVVYREQYIRTNLGYMRYGEDGYVSSFTVYGVHGSYGEDNYSGSPSDDYVLTADFIDESMHDCSGHDVVSVFFETMDDGNEISESSDSSSESSSDNG